MSNYNGYSNRETWATALHLSNDPDLHYYAQKVGALTAIADIISHTKILWPGNLKVSEIMDDIGDLSKVNWNEVAEALAIP